MVLHMIVNKEVGERQIRVVQFTLVSRCCCRRRLRVVVGGSLFPSHSAFDFPKRAVSGTEPQLSTLERELQELPPLLMTRRPPRTDIVSSWPLRQVSLHGVA